MKKCLLLLALILFISPHFVLAQNTGSVKGKIIDTNNNLAIPGVNIVVNGTFYGTAANAVGYYELLNIPAYMSNPPNYVEDKCCIAVEIDIYAKTIEKLDFPRGNMYGGVGIYKDKIIFGLSTDTENGFYTYDMTTKEASSSAVIKTTGMPALFRHFGEEY